MHQLLDLKVFYFGTPVVLIGTSNPDGSTNIAPMSSAWWLGHSCLLGMGKASQTTSNLLREKECSLNLPSASLAVEVDRMALLTGSPEFPERKRERGYRFHPDKFGVTGLTEQAADLVSASLIAECPIQLEARLLDARPLRGSGASATVFEVDIVRTHVEQELIIPGTDYIDPEAWDPLEMRFCEFFGGAQAVHPSQLAGGWRMPHRLLTSDQPRYA